MNFFEAQDKARHNTVLLVLLFVVALAGLVLLLYVAAHFFLREAPPSLDAPDYELLVNVAVGVAALVSLGTLYKILALAAGGGAAVAEGLGGRPIPPATRDPLERRLLNIVSEMALASGCPAPQAYVIPDDNINAFAAGTKISNAVIGVTRGALQTLSRDEMQGVIAHEFSHIMNGDMRLNLRLIGIIHGIMLLSYLGFFLLRGSLFSSMTRGSFGGGGNRSGGAAAAIPLIGIALLAAGAVGAFCGGMIRAAVSRQREYLADAAAVQYTRNPEGIGGALQKIGVKYGLLKTPKAAECAHMFFAPGVSLNFSNMLASHPPIDKRIKRILPNWDGKTTDSAPTPAPAAAETAAAHSGFAAAQMHSANAEEAPPAAQAAQAAQPPDLFAALFGKQETAKELTQRAGDTTNFAAAGKVLRALPPLLQEALSDSYSARALVYAMLLDDKDDSCRRKQCAHLHSFADNGVYELTMQLAPATATLPRAARLPLLLQCLPALRTMSPAQYTLFAGNVAALIAADEQIDLFEWSTDAALSHYLAEHFDAPPDDKLPSVRDATARALSLVARAGHGENAAEVFAAHTTKIRPRIVYMNDGFSPQPLAAALRRLDKLSASHKCRFLQTAADIAAHDGIINADESALLRAFAALLDCPLPPLFAAAD